MQENKNPQAMVEAAEAAERMLGLMRAQLAGCRVHGSSQAEATSHHLLRVNGHSVCSLMDSGSTITLLRPAKFPWLWPSGETLLISCVHGEVCYFPTAQIQLEENRCHWPLTVGLVPDLPVPLLVGRDFPGFSQGHHLDQARQQVS
ncbi:hypothetical protein MHYP_G00288630 [Metynnis hypsauchen]